MPELPEVELLRRGLADQLPGCRITAIDLRLPKVFRADPRLAVFDACSKTVLAVSRRAKHLIVDLSGELSLVIHLRLSGQLVLRRGDETLVAGGHPVPRFDAPLPHKSTHLIFELANREPVPQPAPPLRLFFTDIRQFGFCHLMRRVSVDGYLEAMSLGPEPLDPALTVDAFREIIGRRPRARLKALLLDQSAVAGLGNIYADESLFLARLQPTRLVGTLDEGEVARLFDAIRATLEYALEHGVAQVLNGRALPGEAFPRAHGRQGEPCPTCGTPIVRVRLGGRSTYYCPRCQPESDGASEQLQESAPAAVRSNGGDAET